MKNPHRTPFRKRLFFGAAFFHDLMKSTKLWVQKRCDHFTNVIMTTYPSRTPGYVKNPQHFINHLKPTHYMVRLKGIEPLTYGLGDHFRFQERNPCKVFTHST